MYRILVTKSKRENYETLYQFLTETTTDVENETTTITPKEFEDLSSLDEYVEDMLNNQGYAKEDFIIVDVKNYGISSDIA